MTRRPESYSRLAKTGVLWQYGSALTEVVNIPATMVMARLLAPQDFGIVAAATFFSRLAARLMSFGFNQALIQLKEIRPEHHSSVFVVNLLTGALLWAGLTAAAPWLGAMLGIAETAQVLPILGLGFVLDAIGSVPNALMIRELRLWKGAVTGWIAAIALSGTGIALALNGFGYWSLIYASLAGTVAQTLAITLLTRWRPRLTFSLAAMREVFSFGMGVHAKRLLDYAALNLDNLVVARVLDVASLGLYDKAFTLVNKVVNQLNVGGTGVSFRIFAVIRDERERFRQAYCKVLMTATLISFPILSACIVSAPELIGTLYGDAWLPAVLPFQILCAAGMLRILNQYASSAAQATGWVWSEVWRQAIYTIMIVGGIVAFSRWGLAGAAGAIFVSTATMTVLMHTMLMRATGLTAGRLLRAQMPGVVCSGALVLALLATSAAMRASVPGAAPWLLLGAQVAIGSLAYLAFLFFSRFKEVRSLVNETVAEFAPGLGRFVKP
jgi:PST family polysaccharide transporter